MMWFHVYELAASFLSVCFYFTSACTGQLRFTDKCHINPVIRQLHLFNVSTENMLKL